MKKTSINVLFVLMAMLTIAINSHAQCTPQGRKEWAKNWKVFEKSMEEQVKFLDKFIKKYPTCFYPYFKKGKIVGYASIPDYQMAKENIDKAFELLGLSKDDPNNGLEGWRDDVYNISSEFHSLLEDVASRAKNLQKQYKLDDALAGYNFVLNYNKSGDNYLARAECNLSNLNRDSASNDYIKALDEYISEWKKVEPPLVLYYLDRIDAIENKIADYATLPNKEQIYSRLCQLKMQLLDGGLKDYLVPEKILADCNQALALNPNIPEVKKIVQRLNKTQAIEDEKITDPKGYLQRTYPKHFPMMQLAIEKKDPKAIAYILSLANYEKDLLSDYYYDKEVMLSFKQDVGHIGIKFLKKEGVNSPIILIILREVTINANQKYYDPKFGTQIRKGEYGGAYSFAVSDNLLTLSKINGENYNVRTFRQMFQQDTKWVQSLKDACHCNPENSFTQSFNLTEELTQFTKVEIGNLNWDGSITLYAYDANGKKYRFDGKYSFN